MEETNFNNKPKLFPLEILKPENLRFEIMAFLVAYKISMAYFKEGNYLAILVSWMAVAAGAELLCRVWPRHFDFKENEPKAWSLNALYNCVMLVGAVLLLVSPFNAVELFGVVAFSLIIGALMWAVYSVFESYEKAKPGRNGANLFLFLSVGGILTFTSYFLFVSYR
ncbi:MAG: hypothetical protein EOP04_26385 [Proteobacteria bacterium]|nr:MAG: hypothetical protein EOP04_26385 [Pseudomonadota bacterium]